MPRVMWRGLLPLILLAACRMPPEINDQSNPEDAYRTFRGAVARNNYQLEWKCLGDGFRKKWGLRSRSDWIDGRATILKDGIALKAIKKSTIGSSKELTDGRWLLDVDLLLGFNAKIWMKPQVVLRIETDGDEEPIYELLDELETTPAGDSLAIRVPDWIIEEIQSERVISIMARIEWFIDEIETP